MNLPNVRPRTPRTPRGKICVAYCAAVVYVVALAALVMLTVQSWSG